MKKSDKKLIGEWLDNIAHLLRKKVHAPACEKTGRNDETGITFIKCPANCGCRKDAKSPLNLKTAIVWSAAEYILEIATDFLHGKGKISDLHKLSENLQILQDPVILHGKTHRGLLNILENTKRAILNMVYYISDINVGSWPEYRKNNVNYFIKNLKRCKNLRK